MAKRPLCVVVPAFNEAAVIEASLDALSRVLPKRDIFVVSDGSTDDTVKLARSKKVSALEIKKNRGKAEAIRRVISRRHLDERYEYVMFSDADSRLSPDFVNRVEEAISKRPACIVGTVTSQRKGLISAFRAYEYALGHLLYKQAQDIMGVVLIAPGCAAIYRADILNQLEFSSRTITEDFDLTIQIHRKELGRVNYIRQAEVLTQDPQSLSDYWKQILRWQTGYWQNLFIHKLLKPSSKISLEAYLLLIDAVIGIALTAFIFINLPSSLGWLEIGYLSTVALAAILLIFKRKFWALPYVPLFFAFYLLGLFVYCYAFFRVIFNRGKKFAWGKPARYALEG